MKAKKLLFTAMMSVVVFGASVTYVNAANETSEDGVEVVQEISEKEELDVEEVVDEADAKVMEETEEVTEVEEEEEQDEAALENKKKEKKKTEAKEEKKETKKTQKKSSYTQAELRLLSCVVFTEAGNQSYQGKLAVANVVLNRVKSSKFPNTMNGVVYQRSQFSVATNGMLKRALNLYDSGKFNLANHKESVKAAKAALSGENNVPNYLYFTGYQSRFSSMYPNGRKIGDHFFR